MNLIKRFLYRIVRESYSIGNLPYFYLFKYLSKNKPVFVPVIDAATERSRKHIPDISHVFPPSDKEKILIIHLAYGGMGDHLLYSHIPRIAKQTGAYTKVYFSTRSLIRNKMHLDYIWKKNPYLDGFCNEENLHDYNEQSIASFDITNGNILDQIMLSYGIDDGQRWHEPELYFDVPIIKELTEKIVYDPNFISYSGGLTSMGIALFFKRNGRRVNYEFMSRSKVALPVIPFDSFIKDTDFEMFCGILISCKELYTLTTGTATLAAGLRRPTTVIHGNRIDKYFHHSKLHKYTCL